MWARNDHGFRLPRHMAYADWLPTPVPFPNPVTELSLLCTPSPLCSCLHENKYTALFMTILLTHFYASHSSLSCLGINNILHICFCISAYNYILCNRCFKMLIEKMNEWKLVFLVILIIWYFHWCSHSEQLKLPDKIGEKNLCSSREIMNLRS